MSKNIQRYYMPETDCCAMVRRNWLQYPYGLYLILIKYKFLFSLHFRSTVSETAEGVIIHLIRSMSHFNKMKGKIRPILQWYEQNSGFSTEKSKNHEWNSQ